MLIVKNTASYSYGSRELKAFKQHRASLTSGIGGRVTSHICGPTQRVSHHIASSGEQEHDNTLMRNALGWATNVLSWSCALILIPHDRTPLP